MVCVHIQKYYSCMVRATFEISLFFLKTMQFNEQGKVINNIE